MSRLVMLRSAVHGRRCRTSVRDREYVRCSIAGVRPALYIAARGYKDMQDSEGQEVVSQARVVRAPGPEQFVVMVANGKGGCGKTTLSTNLAGSLARRGRSVALVDLDPQQSSAQWLEARRRAGLDDIRGVTLPVDDRFTYGKLLGTLRGLGDLVVLDAPAGLGGQPMEALLRVSRVVLVPVLPSPIDVRATTRFLQALMLSPGYRRNPRRLAVLANRAREHTRPYEQLELFLRSLKIPFLATVRDQECYALAAGAGLAVTEQEDCDDRERHTWHSVTDWLEIQRRLVLSMGRARALF